MHWRDNIPQEDSPPFPLEMTMTRVHTAQTFQSTWVRYELLKKKKQNSKMLNLKEGIKIILLWCFCPKIVSISLLGKQTKISLYYT